MKEISGSQMGRETIGEVRAYLLQTGQNIIYNHSEISNEYNILQQPDGKAYLLGNDPLTNKTIKLRELNKDEYELLDKYDEELSWLK